MGIGVVLLLGLLPDLSFAAAFKAQYYTVCPTCDLHPVRGCSLKDNTAPFNVTARRQFAKKHDDLVFGYMQDMAAFSVAVLSVQQLKLGIQGAVGEIGVHHGLFFFALAAAARPCEPLIVIDVFGDQQKNIDSSGKGNYNTFRCHAQRFGLTTKIVQQGRNLVGGSAGGPPGTIVTFASASTEVTPSALCAASGHSGVRLFSIDGGHTPEVVYHDLTLLNCVLLDGGLLFMDDYTHSYWAGVQDGVGRFFHLHPNHRLVPVAVVANKLIITTESHHRVYREALITEFRRIGARHVGIHEMKQRLFGWPIVVWDHAPSPDQKTLTERWATLLTTAGHDKARRAKGNTTMRKLATPPQSSWSWLG
jgi:hypothetical protein